MKPTYATRAKAIWKRLTRPRILKSVKAAGTRTPRVPEWPQGEPPVSFAGDDPDIERQMREQAHTLFDGFRAEDRVLIKINHNTAAPYPASTDHLFLAFFMDLLRARGITRIKVGDCSTVTRLPTRRVFDASGIYAALQGKAEIVCFDEGRWVTVPIHGEYLVHVTIPQCVFEADKIIYLANCKTHWLADFSLGMKLAVGFMHPHERYALHRDHLHEKIAEISLALRPDLTIIDARAALITGGPDKGSTASGNTVLAGRDIIQTDMEAYRLLYRLKLANGCAESFSADPFDMGQFRHVKKLAEEGRWR